MTNAHLPFNTAVLYDLENLLGGYSFNARLVADLSLKEIRRRIRETGLTGRFAVQRAYANWSDPRLGILRNEINELGIDPIQVFGFSKDAKRNAADIQLAIDAIDLAHLRPTITHFVIVSGDGGFASLAKKLHEYGRTVIGVAYRKATNQTLRAVCDEFLWIEAPDDEDEPPKPQGNAKAKAANAPAATASAAHLDLALSNVPKAGPQANRETILATARQTIQAIAHTPAYQSLLDQDGIPTTLLGQALHHQIAGLDYTALGFTRLTELLRYLSTGKSWQVARRNGSDNSTRLIRRGRTQASEAWESLADLNETDLHAEPHYRAILGYGNPMIRFGDLSSLELLLCLLEQDPPKEVSLADLVERATGATQGSIPAEKVRQGLFGLVSVGAFLRTPENVPLAEQQLTLADGWRTPADALRRIRSLAREKIQRHLGKVDPALLATLLGEEAGAG